MDETVAEGGASDGSLQGARFDGLRLERLIAVGGQGAVYEGVQEGTGRRVAIKMLRSGILADDTERLRLLRETELLAGLDHPNVVRCLAGGVRDSMPYLVLEHVSGRPLMDHVQEGEASVRERLELFGGICEGVAHAHRSAIIHRDLKPSNVLIDESGQPRVIDFGLARPVLDSSLTAGDGFLGTVRYAAPEQVGGLGKVDTRTDVHALGVLLHELLTGRQPHEDTSSLGGLARCVLDEELPRPSSLNGELDADLDAIVAKATDKDPERRYATVEAFREDVQRYLDGFPIVARRVGWLSRTTKAVRRHPLRSAAVAATLVALASLMAVALYQADLATRQAEQARQEKLLAEATADEVVGFFAAASGEPGAAGSGERQRLLEFAYRWEAGRPDDLPGTRLELELEQVIGRAGLRMGLPDRAMNLLLRSALERSRLPDTTPREMSRHFEDLAGALLAGGRFVQAGVVATRALGLREAELGSEAPELTFCLLLLSRVAAARGREDESEDLLSRALRLAGQDGEGTLPPASVMETVAEIRLALGDAVGAEAAARRALELQAASFDWRDASHVRTRLLLAEALTATGRPAEAVHWLREARGLAQEAHGALPNRVVPTIQHQLGEACLRAGRLIEAEFHLADALKVRRRMLGDEHVDTLATIRCLAEVLEASGRHAEAGRLRDRLRSTLAMMESLAPPDDAKVEESDLRVSWPPQLLELGLSPPEAGP